MAAAEGYSQTNTLLVVVAVAAVAYVLYQRRQMPAAAPDSGAAAGAGAGRRASDQASDYAKAAVDLARGIADLIGEFRSSETASLGADSYSQAEYDRVTRTDAGFDAAIKCVESGEVDERGNALRSCIERYV